MNNSLLGIIGGLGTQASAWFYKRLHALQNVNTEQEYMDILLYSIPSMPDRTAYITGKSKDSPLGALIHAAQTLETAGVSHIAIPCVTSHFFYDDISKAVSIPIVNILEETVRVVISSGNRYKVCLLATDGTIEGRVFHTMFEKASIDLMTPSREHQAELMTLIYDIKRAVTVNHEVLDKIIAKSLENGAETVILGCTELCIAAKESSGVINTLDVLAKACLV
ncbi:MAG: amino acid racemase [Oscillospiraceae bacterium]|jgi:aspartate racemase|nr:amino acid racemase [Oscillospiraceae bacterium]